MKVRAFFKDLINPDSISSTRRFVILVCTAHFILSSFLILFLFMLLVFKTTSGNIDFLVPIIDVFKAILEYDFYIILGGLGFISMGDLANVITKRNSRFTRWGGDRDIDFPDSKIQD